MHLSRLRTNAARALHFHRCYGRAGSAQWAFEEYNTYIVWKRRLQQSLASWVSLTWKGGQGNEQ
ncbi:MAG: hypothetical protein OJI67_20870 [Prosthecobacter sp.]|nr:hypothetical protein [Prosthecobacter sp.]